MAYNSERSIIAIAVNFLADRIQRKPARPGPMAPWYAEVTTLVEFLMDETTREGESAAEAHASALRIRHRLHEHHDTTTLLLARRLLVEQAKFLAATAYIVGEEVKVRAAEGDPIALEIVSKDVGPTMEVHVIDLDAIREKRKEARDN